MTITTFLTIICLICKFTILNKNYFLNKLDSNNYYEKLVNDINNDFDNYLMQSGFSEDILNNLVKTEEVKKCVLTIVNSYYEGKKVSIDDNILFFKTNLENNIDNYLANSKITIADKEAIDLFVKEIVNIYKERIIVHQELINLSSSFSKVINIVNFIFIVLIIIDIVLFIVIKKIYNKITLTIPCLTSALLLLIVYYLLFMKVNINYILLWNDYVSEIIKSIFMDIKNGIIYIGIIIIVIEIFKLLIIKIKSRKN